ncbi:PAS domain S-box protein [Christiangramia sediminis]|uniref:histidine kinase n=1 Tax=Christiangramia sediminis TaxID=2881336 RepID=A0A9X1RXY5_9FLAO|nr:PAS domain S-box protein [Christiangramia sediminis]MCB7481417.1 PAS domain S-box protein [Christiangramia sediminis]
MHSTTNPKRNLKPEISLLEYKKVLQDLPIPIFICDQKGVVTFSNKACKEHFPIILEDDSNILNEDTFNFLDKNAKKLKPEELAFLQALQQKKAIKNQKYYLDRSGTLGYSVSSKIHTGENPEDLAFQFDFLPLNKTKKRSLKQIALSAIVESSNDAIISKDLNGKIISWNKGAEKIFGYTEKEMLGKNVSILIPSSRRQEEKLILKTIKNGKSLDHFETIRVNKAGNMIPLSLTVSPIKDESGQVIGASKVARDISDRLRSEEKQARLSAIVESSDDGIISKDLNGIINSWNIGAKRIFGYSESEVLGKSITLLIPKERLNEETVILKKIHSGERIEHFETIRLSKNGKEVPVSVSVSPLKDSHGKIIGASKIVRNIEEQIKSKQKIESYVEKLRILNSVGKDISSKLDLETVLQKVTDATTKLSGAKFGAFFYNTQIESGESMMLYTLSGAPKQAFEKLGMPRHTAVFQPTFSGQGIVRVDDITQDTRYGRNAPYNGMPTGHLQVTSYMAIPVISTSGNVIGGLIFGHPEKGVFKKEHEIMVRNIAAQAAITLDNSQLFEKVKSLSEKKDEFIALASHELKTPLTTIKGYLQILEKKIEEPKSKLFLSKTLDQANRLNILIDDLLNMSRIEAGKLEFNYEEFDFREMLFELSETYNYSEISHRILPDIGDKALFIKADKQRIEQVLNNLLNNAIKYSPNADKVYLKLQENHNKVTVIVKDEGLGLTPEQQKNVFNRFYRAESTKGINGLGLGLYLTKQIIDAHNGKLGVKSEEGKGSEFFFSLPLKNEIL